MASPVSIPAVAKKRNELRDKYGDKSIWLITTDSPDNKVAGIPDGVVSDATAYTASFAIMRGTHREATDSEVAKFKADLATRDERLKQITHDSRQMYALPAELSDLVKALAQSAGKKKE